MIRLAQGSGPCVSRHHQQSNNCVVSTTCSSVSSAISQILLMFYQQFSNNNLNLLIFNNFLNTHLSLLLQKFLIIISIHSSAATINFSYIYCCMLSICKEKEVLRFVGPLTAVALIYRSAWIQ